VQDLAKCLRLDENNKSASVALSRVINLARDQRGVQLTAGLPNSIAESLSRLTPEDFAENSSSGHDTVGIVFVFERELMYF
jgi:hypothetical protein